MISPVVLGGGRPPPPTGGDACYSVWVCECACAVMISVVVLVEGVVGVSIQRPNTEYLGVVRWRSIDGHLRSLVNNRVWSMS